MTLFTQSLRGRQPYGEPPSRSESLPFVVRLVDSPQDLAAAVDIRATAYARHLPTVGEMLRTPERDDESEHALVLLAEQKLDRRTVGSIRLQTNLAKPLMIETVVELPSHFSGRRLAEARRLGVANGPQGQMVAAALFKATYEICFATGVDFLIVAGRRSLADMYRSLLFQALFDQPLRLPYVSDLPHEVFALPIAEADRSWRAAQHALYDFMARTHHPDLKIDFDRADRRFAK